MSSADTPKYWFPAKKIRLGLGTTMHMARWIVFIIYFALVIVGIPFIQVAVGGIVYIAYVLILTVALIAICWITGEPPRWRWGDRDS